MGSEIQSQKLRRDPEGSNGIQNLLSNFTTGSDWIMDPIPHLVEIFWDLRSDFGIHGRVC